MSHQLVFVISAPSGGGKTSLVNALKKTEPALEHVVTHTTRAMRVDEIANVHYHFVSHSEFQQLIAQDDLVEWAEVYGQYYGTSKAAVDRVLQQHKYPVLNIDWQGARNIRKIYGTQAKTIFILPPSLAELQKRLEQRGDSHENIQKRVMAAQDEMNHANEYDAVILNECFDTALAELKAVIQASLK